MISKIGEELLGMEKVAKTIDHLGAGFGAYRVEVRYREMKHKKIHVHIVGPGKEEYTYFPYTQEYDEDSKIPKSSLDKAIRAYCAKNLEKIKTEYLKGSGGLQCQ